VMLASRNPHDEGLAVWSGRHTPEIRVTSHSDATSSAELL
jgi:hypothetical protein